MPGVRFTDVTREAGIHFLHNNGAFGKFYLPETMGSGCAFFDFDNDGWEDLLLVNGMDWPDHRRHRSTMALYRNNHNGTFEDATREAGLDFEFPGMGVAIGDYDNDGWDDFYISGLGGGRLFHNEGNGRFRDVTLECGIHSAGFGTSCAWADFNRDGKLDLFLCNYAKWSEGTDAFCSFDGLHKNYCRPAVYPPDTCQLFLNVGNGSFRDVTEEAGIYSPSCKALGVVVVDYDLDGWPDIFVTNDTMPNRLYHNNKDGTFTEVGLGAGVALDTNGLARAGMGVDAADIDHSGYPSFVVGNFSMEMLGLFRNHGGKYFVDEAEATGIGASSLYSLTFGCLFFDFDLDGHEDILAANGHIMTNIHDLDPRFTYPQSALLYRNQGDGTFVQMTREKVGPDLFIPLVGRGLACGDFDGDGDLDVLITQNNGPARLLRNDRSNDNHWLRIRLVGTKSNKNGYGAVIKVTTNSLVQTKTVKSNCSYCSQSQPAVTFGLGKTAQLESVGIIWPSGLRETYEGIGVDQAFTAVEGQGIK